MLRIWTDGGCYPNPGPGGWGVHAVYQDGTVIERNGFGGDDTTNNKMEMMAVMQGLSLILPEDGLVTLYSDSQYVIKGLTEWMPNWKRNGWKTANGKPVKNIPEWRQLENLARSKNVLYQWVKGHNGDPGNERADTLATMGKNGELV